MNTFRTQSITPLGLSTYQVVITFPDDTKATYQIHVEDGEPPLLQPDLAFEALMFRGAVEDNFTHQLFKELLDLHGRQSSWTAPQPVDAYDLSTPVTVPPATSRQLQEHPR